MPAARFLPDPNPSSFRSGLRFSLSLPVHPSGSPVTGRFVNRPYPCISSSSLPLVSLTNLRMKKIEMMAHTV